MKQRRAAVDAATHKLAGLKLAEQLSMIEAWTCACTVASFMPCGSEIDTGPIDTLAREQGKHVVYPRITDDNVMTFHYWSPGQALERSRFGIQEPSESALEADMSGLDLILVPLLACDREGYRLGYGGGFYDQFLAHTRAPRFGLGFHWQLINRVPRQRHDQRISGFISEGGTTCF